MAAQVMESDDCKVVDEKTCVDPSRQRSPIAYKNKSNKSNPGDYKPMRLGDLPIGSSRELITENPNFREENLEQIALLSYHSIDVLFIKNNKETTKSIDRLLQRYLSEVVLVNNDEIRDILSLINEIREDKVCCDLSNNSFFAEIIFAYFSSKTETNPSAIECYKRWIEYKRDNPIYCNFTRKSNKNSDNNIKLVGNMLQSHVFEITFRNDINDNNNNGNIEEKEFDVMNSIRNYNDKIGLPMALTKYYNSKTRIDVAVSGAICFFTSLLWDCSNNIFHLNHLRNGVDLILDISDIVNNMYSWTHITGVRNYSCAFPWVMNRFYILHPPRVLKLFRKLAEKCFSKKAMNRAILVKNYDQLFEKYNVSKDYTPIACEGNSKKTVYDYVTSRGCL